MVNAPLGRVQMEALLQKVSEWFHSSSKTAQHDTVGKFKADYSPLSPDEIAAEDRECAELFKNSKPVSR